MDAVRPRAAAERLAAMIAGPGETMATAIVPTNNATCGGVIPSNAAYSAVLRFTTASISGASTAFMPTT